ncbi:MAG: response regulator [Anaerolineae bacterium]|nr:response regulator [Anaerolineae bacterium]MDW8173809.1 response regulator [Anaerolineae bacterium]
MERSEFYILMVEDDQELANFNQIVLRRAGFTAQHAADGEQAVAMLDARRPDIVLLDLNLPGLSGWYVLEYMNQRYPDRQIPVIVTTAQSDPANRVVGKIQAVYRYLIKPFDRRELIAAIESALGLS